MTHWAAQLIGTPWCFGGKNLEMGFDCWGFFRYIQLMYYKIDVPHITINEYNFKEVVEGFSANDEYNNWREVMLPQDGDAVLMRMAKYPNHVGVWVDTGTESGVLHTVENTGAMFSNRNNLKIAGWNIIGYYRHKSKK